MTTLAWLCPFAAGQAHPPSALGSRPSRKDISHIGDDEIKVRTVAIIVTASLIGCFFIMGCLSVLLTRHCVRHQLGLTATLESHGASAPTRPRLRRFRRGISAGLDPSIIDTFPTIVYSLVCSKVKMDGMPLECAVCLSEFEDGEILQLLPKCRHVFHPDCIEKWLSIRVTCPVCRFNLAPKPDHQLASVGREPEPEPAGSVGVNDSIIDVRSGDH